MTDQLFAFREMLGVCAIIALAVIATFGGLWLFTELMVKVGAL